MTRNSPSSGRGYTRTERLGMLLILAATLALCALAWVKSERKAPARDAVTIQTVYAAPDSAAEAKPKSRKAKKSEKKKSRRHEGAPNYDSPLNHPILPEK